MSDNVVIPLHAAAATISLLLGAYNLLRRARGDRAHRLAGRVWVAAMYCTILSSFAIRALNPGHFSWIHGLSVFTFVTLSIGLWAAVTGRVRTHRRFMTGSYLGLLGAFAGAVVVPQRDIPQWIVHRPGGLTLGALGCVAVAGLVVLAARRGAAPYDQASPERVRQ
ncbi:DUF2306 domain-containing protein [Dactylosporangium sp. CA-233914]|uniref:DUF2306 domain-containing protein n=1 Tax=Dactylosporangium sp. CA-233914 TaxID=3239934 RepID=UPI003D9083E7